MARMSKERRQRRSFTDEFKTGAVRLVLDEGKTIAQVARDLDLTPSALGGWVEQARADRSKGKTGLTTEERAELAKLKKENRELRMERDILKNSRSRPGRPPARPETLGGVPSCAGRSGRRLFGVPRTRKKTWSGGGLRT
jgi:transposase